MRITRTLLAAAAIAVGISTFSQAQEENSWRVNVPFDFTVRHTHLPAGTYTVQESGKIVMLTSMNGKTANVLTNSEYIAKPASKSSLTFQVDGGAYDLIQIQNMGSGTALNAVTSKRTPKPLEASIASQTVEVAAVGTR